MINRNILKSSVIIFSSLFLSINALFLTSCDGVSRVQHEGLLKDIYNDYFSVGAALSSNDFKNLDDLLPHYNSVTAMYEMKWGHLEPSEGYNYYNQADNFVKFAEARNLGIRGHTLVWYRNVPNWFINKKPSKEQALSYMQEYINKTIAHFKDAPIYAWDVVNEVLHDSITQEQLDSGNLYRNAIDDAKHFNRANVFDWYSTCGDDFIEIAFKTAEQACIDNGLSDMKLFYNDYSLNDPLKRDACVEMIQELLDNDVKVDGIGMQSHYYLSSYLSNKKKWIDNFDAAIKAYTGLGIEVQITELDIDPGVEELDEKTEKQQAEMYGKIFDVCRKYSTPWKEGAGTVTNVTTWGVIDNSNGGNKYIFDQSHQEKEAFKAITYF